MQSGKRERCFSTKYFRKCKKKKKEKEKRKENHYIEVTEVAMKCFGLR